MLPEPACLLNHLPCCQNQPRPIINGLQKYNKTIDCTNFLRKNEKKSQKCLVVQKKVVSLQSQMRVTPSEAKIGPVVQLVRIHACHAWGREFESRPDRKGF